MAPNAAALGLTLLMATHALAADPARVSVATVAAQPVVEEVGVVGTVVAPQLAAVSTEIPGRIASVEIALGDTVAKGAALIQLDDTLARLSLESLIAAERADVARLGIARRELANARRLVDQQNLPANELDRREATVAEAEAVVAQERADIAERRERIARHLVRAPFAGAIVSRLVEVGEWVEPGDTIVELIGTQRLVVDLVVAQRYFPRIDANTTVTLSFEALPDVVVAARVLTRVPLSDPTARTFRLRVEPVGAPLDIAPGMSARATLRLEDARAAVVVPRDAINRHADGRVTVWTAADGENGPIAEERSVLLGAAARDGGVYVTEGLDTGSRVVTRGNETLSPGLALEIASTDGGRG